jgi:DNA-binding HxlR family transcriptional regulator
MRLPLTDADYRTLHAVAISGRATYSELLKSLKGKVGSNKTLLYSLKKLEFLKLVKTEKKEGRGPCRGRKATVYKPTLEGLYLVLLELVGDLERSREELDTIALNNRELLPCIFGFWQTFKTKGVADVAYELLKSTVYENSPHVISILAARLRYYEFIKRIEPSDVFIPPQKVKETLGKLIKAINNGYGRVRGIPNGVAEEIFKAFEEFDRAVEALEAGGLCQKFYFPSKMLPEGYAAFLKVCMEDEELGRCIMEQLEQAEKAYAGILGNIRNLKTWLKQCGEP